MVNPRIRFNVPKKNIEKAFDKYCGVKGINLDHNESIKGAVTSLLDAEGITCIVADESYYDNPSNDLNTDNDRSKNDRVIAVVPINPAHKKEFLDAIKKLSSMFEVENPPG